MRSTRPLQLQISQTPNILTKQTLATPHQPDHGLDLRKLGHLLQHCTNHHLIHQGKQIHARIIQFSVAPDNFLASKLINFYSKSNHLFQAHKVFDEIPQKNIFSWNAILIACSIHNKPFETMKLYSSLVSSSSVTDVKPDNFTINCVLKALSSLYTDSNLAKEIHAYVLRKGYEVDIFVVNALVTFYARSGDLGSARRLFDSALEKDIVSWNSMIAGYSHSGMYAECLELYREMVGSAEFRPNGVTVVSVLLACAQLKDLEFGVEVQRYVIESNIEMDLAVWNSIIGMYAKCGNLDYARKLFEKMKEKDEVSYGAMISGYMIHGFAEQAIELFREMRKPILSTWNAMLSGLVQNNYHERIPELLREMQETGLKPNCVTLASVLPTFSYFSNLKVGKQMHCYAIRNGYDGNIYVTTALIDTYAKLGFLHGAHKVFMQCRSNSVISWTAIISAYAAHGDADLALSLFAAMLNCGTKPDPVTFMAVLSACAHSGAVDEARKIFDSMLPCYKIHPSVEHYACMVGVFSRAGMLLEAVNFVSKMPIEPSAKVWGALLNGASVSGDVELGKFVCDRLFEIEPENTGNYIIMANLYSRAGRWAEAEKMREKMKNTGLKKIPGCSWIETKKGLQSFIAGDVSNQKMEDINVMLDLLVEPMREEGYESVLELDEESLCSTI